MRCVAARRRAASRPREAHRRARARARGDGSGVGQSLEAVAALPRLRHLNVYLCKLLSSGALRRMQARKPRLTLAS